MNFRVTDEQKATIEANAKTHGFESVGAYIKFVCTTATVAVTITKPNKYKDLVEKVKKAYVACYTNYNDDTLTALDDSFEDIRDVSKEDVSVIALLSSIQDCYYTDYSSKKKRIGTMIKKEICVHKYLDVIYNL